MTHAQAGPVRRPRPGPAAPHGLELRHLRYFAAVADAGAFTRAADQLFLAQPTLSQQIARLEDLIGAPLLARRRDGVRLTAAGTARAAEHRHGLSPQPDDRRWPPAGQTLSPEAAAEKGDRDEQPDDY